MENEKEMQQDNVADRKKESKKDAPKKGKASQIEINPKLEEAKGGTVVLGWGRMNPITTGHEKLVNKIVDVARKENATPIVYLTHSQNAKKDPLSYNDKIMLAQRAFGKIVQKSNSNTIIKVMQELQGKYKDVVLVVGEDRIKEFDTLLNKYNGKDYTFDSIKVISAGSRVDPDSEKAKEMTASSMSASVMRKLASEGDFETFKKGLPKKLQSNAQDVYDMVRSGMKIAEMMEEEESDLQEVLSIAQRRKRAVQMRRYKNKIAMARKRFAKKPADKKRLMMRSRKAAIKKIRAMVAGKKGQNYDELSPSEKAMIDQRVQKKKAAIDRIAKRLMPAMKRADMARLAQKNEDLDLDFDTMLDEKRHHQTRNKDGSMKFDGRFRAFRQARVKQDNVPVQDDEVRMGETEVVDESLLAIVDEIHTSIYNENLKIKNKIIEKANKHDTLADDLFEIYYEAVNEEFDYNMTPQQYAFNAINTYLANLGEGVNDPGIFKAVFLAGGPGSGKSFIVGKTALTTMGLKLINSDDAFEHQLKKVGLSTTPEDIYSDLGQSVRGKAKALTAKRQSIALMGRLGLVVDGTGKDFDKIKKQADELKKIGYEVAMVFVNTDLDTAQARNKARTRTLPEDEVKAMWDAVQKNMGKFQNYFGSNFVIVDNSDGANYEGAVNNAYRKMSAWIKKDPIKPAAKKWIKSQKAERGMKEEVNLDESFEAIIENEGEQETAKMRAIKSMMNREKANRQRDLAQKARDKGDNEKADKHMDAARKMQREEVELDEEPLSEEEKMSKAQMKKREEIVKSMKKDKKDFKDRYGDKADDVMYATATKMAMKSEEAQLDEAKKDPNKLDPKDVEAHLVKKGVNPKDAKKAVMKGFGYANKKYGGPTYAAAVKKVAEVVWSLHEEVEQLDENMSRVAKELEAYARKNGGIDKMDFMKAAMMMKKGQKSQLKKFVDDLDTEPREKILSLIDKDEKRRSEYNKFQKSKRNIKEAVATGKQKSALKALMRQALGGKAPGKGYTSSIATNGDFVVYDGGMRIQGRIKKGDFKDPMKG